MTKQFTYENTIAELKAHPFDLRLMYETMNVITQVEGSILDAEYTVVDQILSNLEELLKELQKVMNYPLFVGSVDINHYIVELKRLQVLIALQKLHDAFKDITQSIKEVVADD